MCSVNLINFPSSLTTVTEECLSINYFFPLFPDTINRIKTSFLHTQFPLQPQTKKNQASRPDENYFIIQVFE
jgi:hypothetical protein